MDEPKSNDAPDLTRGISVTDLGKTGKVVGKVGDAEVLVVKQGEECFAIGAHCTHYKGPLVDGLVVGDTVRCPWHHACFSLRTGEACAPACARSSAALARGADRRSDRRPRQTARR